MAKRKALPHLTDPESAATPAGLAGGPLDAWILARVRGLVERALSPANVTASVTELRAQLAELASHLPPPWGPQLTRAANGLDPGPLGDDISKRLLAVVEPLLRG